MKRVLLTGMSGVGKSTLTRQLAGRGYKAVDLDSPEWSEWVSVNFEGDPALPESPAGHGRDWVWREDRVQRLLDNEDARVLIVSGCAENMRRFLPRFDHVLLLATPDAVLVERLAARPSGSYGSRPEERERVLGLVRTVEPRLRRVASHVLDTGCPIDVTLAEIVRLCDEGIAEEAPHPPGKKRAGD